MYAKPTIAKAEAYWIGSLSLSGPNDQVMSMDCNGVIGNRNCGNADVGFRPLIKLKKGVKLIENTDETTDYKIK